MSAPRGQKSVLPRSLSPPADPSAHPRYQADHHLQRHRHHRHHQHLHRHHVTIIIINPIWFCFNIKLQSGFPNFQMEALLNDFDYTWHPVEMWGTTNALCDSRTPAYTTSKASCQCWCGAWPGEVNTLILIMTSMWRIFEMSRTGTSDLQHQRMVVT